MSRKFLTVLMAWVAPIACAQAQLKFGIAAGASRPNGDFAASNKSGYHAMVTAGIQPPLAPVGVRIDGMFNRFDYQGTLLEGESDRIAALSANAVLGVPGVPLVASPYLIGGAGIYNRKASVEGATSSSTAGFNLGAGIKFGLAGFGAFGEARLHWIMANDAEGLASARFIPITFGITF
jgi:hypothetical protein